MFHRNSLAKKVATFFSRSRFILISASSRLTSAYSIFTVLAKMEDASAAPAVNGFAQALNHIEAQKYLSITYYQGREMAGRQQLAAETGIKVYFADPHSAWQRDRNENINGLTRPYLSKGVT